MGSFIPRHVNHKLIRLYEVIDIETGEVLKKPNNKEYITVNNEITSNNNKIVKNGRLHEYTTITTRRFVKHTGQQRFEI